MNIMMSLFTPTKVFTMDNDEMFKKYKEQNKTEEGMDAGIKNNAEACWKWMTSREALEKADRQKPVVKEALTKEIADELDKLLIASIGNETNHLMVPGSNVWEEAYTEYVKGLKGIIDKKYTTELCEEPNRLTVNQTIWRKMEWVTMKHQGRQEPSFPLMTKSLLPRMADVLRRVQNAIAEVCTSFCLTVVYWIRRWRRQDARMY